jgi:STE24 endopeptidase
LATFCVSLGLRYLNVRHLRKYGSQVPPELAGNVDQATLAKITTYTEERTRLGLVTSVIMNALMLAFLFAGGIGFYERWVHGITSSWLLSGLIFFLGLLVVETLIGVPFALYANFKLEARYGFNRMSPKLWLGDFVKNLVMSAILMALVTLVALWLVQAAPNTWWLWVWAFLASMSLLLMYIAPYVIEPLFHKIEPLKDAALESDVRSLSERAGVHVKHVLQMDASRRSGHSNAYFTGIGRTKRVVLFDTLLAQMTKREIIGVLAHELGHWKKGHIIKTLIASQVFALVSSYAAFRFVNWESLPTLFGSDATSFPARVLFLAFLGSIIMFPLTPLFSYLSRRHEWEADAFASELTRDPESLAHALAKLARENLSNLHPHPLYAAFYYSHPPMTERIRKLMAEKPRTQIDFSSRDPVDLGASGKAAL